MAPEGKRTENQLMLKKGRKRVIYIELESGQE